MRSNATTAAKHPKSTAATANAVTAARARSGGALRAIAVLPLAATVAFGLAACGSDDEGAAAAGANEGAAAQADAEGKDSSKGKAADKPKSPGKDEHSASDPANSLDGNDPGAGGNAHDAPGVSNADLILTAADFPGLDYQQVTPEQTQAALKQMQQLASVITFNPPECADATNVAAQLPDGTAMANIVDNGAGIAYTIGVLGTGVNTADFAAENQRCRHVTMSGSGISGTTTTEPVAGPRIPRANVQAFDVHSTSRVEALNKEQSQVVASYQVTTRGVTYRVAATQLRGDLSADARGRLDDIARRQAEKIARA